VFIVGLSLFSLLEEGYEWSSGYPARTMLAGVSEGKGERTQRLPYT